MQKLNSFFIIILMLSALIISSCEKDETPEIPALPPVDALVMDFSDFTENPGEKKSLIEMPGATYQNFVHGLANVTVWNIVVTVTMAVPTASYIAAFDNQPEYMGDNTWKWEYSVNSGAATYTAMLMTSRISNDEFKAEMYISKDGIGAFTEFKWFEGTIRYDRTHAIWTLFESPAVPNELLEIEWNKNWEEETSDISYTNIKSGDPENGSFIKYEITNDTDFDAMYTISTAANLVNIEWNLETKAGRISDPLKFGDNDWRCWNELLEDIDCN